MIRINLVPQDEARRQADKQRDRQVAVGVVLSLLSILAVSEWMTRSASSAVEEEAERYRTQLVALNEKYQEKVLLERKSSELQAKLATIELLERQRRGPVRVLEDLGDATPAKLWLTEMRESGGAVVLSGRGLDNQTVALFMRNLEQSPYFSRVELVETKQVEEGKAKLKEFAIRSTVLYAGRPPEAEPTEEGAEEETATNTKSAESRKSS